MQRTLKRLFCGIIIFLIQPQAGYAEINCYPEKIKASDILNIDMSVPHGKEMGIKTPDGSYFFIFYTRRGIEFKSEPINTNEIFSSISGLKIKPSQFLGRRWHANADSYERVFKKKGVYKISVAKVLESDIPEGLEQCQVEYLGE